jgi:hypothetical protein
MDKKEKKEKEEMRREIKEEVYTKYTDIIDSLIKKDYYAGYKSTLTTFLAFNMCAEATKKNLVKMGIDSSTIENARRTIIQEIWQLMELYDKGVLQQLIQRHEREESQQE